mgnify:CR=1 FL=1
MGINIPIDSVFVQWKNGDFKPRQKQEPYAAKVFHTALNNW